MSFIKVLDKKICTENVHDAKYVIKEGGRVSYVNIPPQGSVNTNTSTFVLNNCGPNTARDRRIWLNVTGAVVLTGTNFTAANVATNLGWKAWPLNRVIQSCTHVLNSSTDSYQNYQYIDWLGRIKYAPDVMNFFDNTAPDSHTNFVSDANTISSPFIEYVSVPVGDVNQSRTVGIQSIAVNEGQTTITVTFSLWEPLITPYSSVNPCDLPALFAIDGENIVINWFNNCKDMICYNVAGLGDGATVTNVAVTFNTMNLYTRYITAPQLILPETSLYQFPKFQVFQTNIGTIAAGGNGVATVQVNSQTMPSKLIIFVRSQETSRTGTIPDWYATITSVQIQINNGNYLFNGASVRQLYDCSVQNGLRTQYPLFSQQILNGVSTETGIYGCGSVLVVDPALDCSISPDDLTNCSAGKYTVQIIINYANNSNADSMPDAQAYCYVSNDSVLIRAGRKYASSYVAFTREQVLNANHLATFMDHEEYENAQNMNLFLSGGGFKSFFSKLFEGAKKVGKYIYDNREEFKKVGQDAHKLYKDYQNAKVKAKEEVKGMGMYY